MVIFNMYILFWFHICDFIFIPSYEKLVQILLLFWWLYNILFCWHHSLTYGELLVPTSSVSLKNQVLGVASIQWLLHLLFKNIWEGHTSRSVVYSHRSFCLNSLCGLFPWWTEPDHGGPLAQAAFHLFHLLDHTVGLYILAFMREARVSHREEESLDYLWRSL